MKIVSKLGMYVTTIRFNKLFSPPTLPHCMDPTRGEFREGTPKFKNIDPIPTPCRVMESIG